MMCEVTIRVRGQLDPRWAHWFEGLEIAETEADETRLHGRLPDQTALYGLLSRLRDLNLVLLSVEVGGES
jgi:hypothetical protein